MPNRTVAGTFRTAFRDAIVAAIGDRDVQIQTGHPGGNITANDVVLILQVKTHQEPKSMGTQRHFEETLTAQVLVSTWRPGGQEAEDVAHTRAFELLGAIEHQMRFDDTTVGGQVLWCWLTDTEHESDPAEQDNTAGRATEILATFTAMVRITN